MTQDKIPSEITPEQSTDTLDDYLIMQKPGDVIDLAEQEQRYAERQFFASLAERTELDAAFHRGFAIGFLRVLEEDFNMLYWIFWPSIKPGKS